jgi:hypothetical protein
MAGIHPPSLPCKPVRYERQDDDAQEGTGKKFRPFGWKPSFVDARELDSLLQQ